ncbi:TPA: UDP-glucose 4-epimerase GalE, partial [Escherichia coli]
LMLLNEGYDIVVIDNFSNSSPKVIERIEFLSQKKVCFHEGDIRDERFLKSVFKEHVITTVIHFASLKSVSESILMPIEYYDNNISGTLTLLKVMNCFGVNNFIFSSSATVYGTPSRIPLDESCDTGDTTNPYGTSKHFLEQILIDTQRANPALNIMLLRYFNPVGAHSSGFIGEDPNGIPNNLFPYITQVAIGRLPRLSIFGDDYPTEDGTGVRDYIHVMDLASGHVAALNRQPVLTGLRCYNLGTGKGYSVKEIVETFQKITGKKIPYIVSARRPGDIAECWSSPELAKKELHWEAKRSLEDMVIDAWNWQNNNPNGYLE